MDTSNEKNDKAILLKIAKNLLQAQQELDEMALQLSLGKAEARDKFEEIKEEFTLKLAEVKKVLAKTAAREVAQQLLLIITELEAVLSSPKPDSRESFELKRELILAVFKRIEVYMKQKLVKLPGSEQFAYDIEKFKLKLEILRLTFVVKKFEIKDAFRTGLRDAQKVADNIAKGARSGVKTARGSYRDLRDEIQLGYSHLKKAVKNIR